MKKYLLVGVSCLVFFSGCTDDKKSEKSVEKTKVDIVTVSKNTPKIVEETIKKAKTGEQLYSSCKACHGVNGELKALGASKIIKDLDVNLLSESLLGYKNKTYGGTTKAIMESQMNMFSEEEINLLVQYISRFQ